VSTGIQWTDETWNPARGCSRVSPGCDHCYAIREARRMDHPGGPYEGLTTTKARGLDWSGVVRLVPEKLDEPLRWRKPRRIFVNSMSDLFHESLSDEAIAAVFGVMAACPQHTFQVLTKRPKRMWSWFESWRTASSPPAGAFPAAECMAWAEQHLCRYRRLSAAPPRYEARPWPLPNVWLGVSAEDQQRLDERARWLLETPAAVRFLSLEPLLGPVNLRRARSGWPGTENVLDVLSGYYSHAPLGEGIGSAVGWVIVGGESGHGARPCSVEWIRSIRDQCRKERVPCFVKQLGSRCVSTTGRLGPRREPLLWALDVNGRKGGDWSEWPADLRAREFPCALGTR